MIKAAQLSQMHEGETEKSQKHVSHSTNGERNDSDNVMVDVFRWSLCKTPLPQKVLRSVGIPLPLDYVEVLHVVILHFYFVNIMRFDRSGCWVNCEFG